MRHERLNAPGAVMADAFHAVIMKIISRRARPKAASRQLLIRRFQDTDRFHRHNTTLQQA